MAPLPMSEVTTGMLHALGKFGELGAGVARHDAAAGVDERALAILGCR